MCVCWLVLMHALVPLSLSTLLAFVGAAECRRALVQLVPLLPAKCGVWSEPAGRLGDAVVDEDEEGRGRKTCPN